MAKKKTLRPAYASKGERKNISKAIVNDMRANRCPYEKEESIREAWLAGKNPWVTEANPDKGTNRPFIKIRSNVVWGDPRKRRLS